MKSFYIIAMVILSLCIHIFEAKPRLIFLSPNLSNFPRWHKLVVYNIELNIRVKSRTCLWKRGLIKAELPKVGILICTQCPSPGIFIKKKLAIEKTKTTWYTTSKIDIIKAVLVFSIYNIFTNKIPREGNWVRFLQ